MTRSITNCVAVMTLAAVLAVAPAVAQDTKLLASDGVPGDRFGELMAADGDVAVVVVPGNGAYVFRRGAGGWAEEQKLVPSDGAPLFGTAVDVQADTIVVGAGDVASSPSGAVYVFRYGAGAWSETQILVPSVAQSYDGFGTAVRIDGDTLAVGVPGFDPPWGPPPCPTPRGCLSVPPGAVFIFTSSGGGPYNETQIVDGTLVPQPSPAAGLGELIGISGDVLVTVYEATRWTLQFERSAPSSPLASTGWFGAGLNRTLVMDGDWIAASNEGAAGIGAEAVRVASRTGALFGLVQVVSASDGVFGDGFGTSIDLVGDRLLVGAPGHDQAAPDAGAAYVLTRTGPEAPFVELTRFVPCDGVGGEEYGASVALAGTDVLVGAPGANAGQGALYIAAECNGTPNQPPVADAGPDRFVEADCASPGGATAVLLDGSASSDPDGDPLTFEWSGTTIVTTYGEQALVDLDLGVHAIDLTVDDGNGGTDTDRVSIEVADITPPEVFAPAPLVVSCSSTDANGRGQASATEAAVADWLASATAADACDESPAVSNDAPAWFPAGSATVTFSASDASGNSASSGSALQVVYDFGGFEPPLLQDNSASIKQNQHGRTIPVKFSLSCGPTAAWGAVATIAVFQVVDVATGDTDTTDLTGDSGSSNDDGNLFRYDPDGEHYIYNLSTRGFAADATYRVFVTLDDGTVHSVDFSLR